MSEHGGQSNGSSLYERIRHFAAPFLGVLFGAAERAEQLGPESEAYVDPLALRLADGLSGPERDKLLALQQEVQGEHAPHD